MNDTKPSFKISKKQEFINLSIWTVIFVVASFYFNGLVYREGTSALIAFTYSLIGFIFLIGFVVSWIKFFVSLRKK